MAGQWGEVGPVSSHAGSVYKGESETQREAILWSHFLWGDKDSFLEKMMHALSLERQGEINKWSGGKML